jgi:hypothetical protein
MISNTDAWDLIGQVPRPPAVAPLVSTVEAHQRQERERVGTCWDAWKGSGNSGECAKLG